MSGVTGVTARRLLGQALDFARSAEPRTAISRRSVITDMVFAALIVAASLMAARFRYPAVLAAVVTSAPLAARRRFPLAVFLVVLAGTLATKDYATAITFLAVVIAGYSAAVHSRFRGAALVCVPLAGVAVAAAFWNAKSDLHTASAPSAPGAGSATPPPLAPFPGHIPVLASAQQAPWRLAGVLVLVSLASIAIVAIAAHARDRIRRLQAGQEAATRRALELERARIAGELHDVVTHNVSVMIVQAGAARQVLADNQGQAKAALLAVESSGRAAMTELRQMLGLLSPPPGPEEGTQAGAADSQASQDLLPQPGLGQLQALIDRVAAAGLPVDLHVSDVPPGLPPGVELAAYRVVQEALTNVIKHAGKPRTSVGLGYREGSLTVEIADAGRPIPAAGPAVPGDGRGLLGLRERTKLLGGELTAGPRPGGGWLVRARIPADSAPTGTPGSAAVSPANNAPASPASPAPASPARPSPLPAGPR
jgi:signal transduction histidine kinase